MAGAVLWMLGKEEGMGATLQWRRDLRHHTVEMLEALGGDSTGVASRLRELGVRGLPGDPGSCAIAVYLSAVIAADPAVKAVKVMPARVVVNPARRLRPPVVIGLPEPVRTFISAFDRNAMPELVRPRTSSPGPRPSKTGASGPA